MDQTTSLNLISNLTGKALPLTKVHTLVIGSGAAGLNAAVQLAQEQEDQAAIASTLGRLGWIFWVNGKTQETAWLAEQAIDLDWKNDH